ncbi:MAG: radical SAM protein [Candidatus Omnitrophota bacterium]
MLTAFIKPNTKALQYSRVSGLSAIEPPVWLTLLSQTMPDGIVVDMEAEELDRAGLLRRLAPLHIGRVFILATGSHPSAHVQQSSAVRELRSFLIQELSVPVEVLDYLPFDPVKAGAVDWNRILLEKYRAHNWHAWGRKDQAYGATFTSISCPFSCNFCCVKDFYHSDYHQRSPVLVVEDIRSLVSRGVTNIKLMDELFAIDNPGVRAVCEALVSSGFAEQLNIWAYARIDTVNPPLLARLRAAGVRWLAYGIESGDERIRGAALKGNFSNARIREVVAMTKDAGIHVVGNFMFGFWEDDRAALEATFDLAAGLMCEYANFYCLSVYPGSKLYADMKARGVNLPESGEEYAQMSPSFKPVPTAHLTGQEVLMFRDSAFMRYFTDTRYLAMMRSVFGEPAVAGIRAMTAIDIRSRP